MKEKLIKKVCTWFMLSVIVISNIGAVFVSASNWQNSPYSAYSSGDGSDSATNVRNKTNTTKVYAYNQNSNKTHRITIKGTTQTSGDGIPGTGNNCTYGASWYDVKPGTQKYMSSVVYERGYRNCFLEYSEANGKVGNLNGVWSPDSIGAN